MSNLSATELHDTNDNTTPDPPGFAPGPVEVRRNRGLGAAVGAVAALVAIGYLARAVGGGSGLDWLLAVGLGALGAAYLMAFVDSRTPLLVADSQGVRIRLGHTWRGLPWSAIDHVEHRPRRGLLRDGRLVLVARDPDEVVAGLDGAGRRQAAIARRLYGSPLAIPLALSTRVVGAGAGADLTATLERLAGDTDRVLETGPRPFGELDRIDVIAGWDEPWEPDDPPAHPALHDPRPTLARGIGFVADRLRMPGHASEGDHGDEGPEPTRALPLIASATPLPLRDPVTGTRAEVRFEGAAALALDGGDDVPPTELPEAAELRWAEPVDPVIDDLAYEPVADAVIGSELVAARTRLGLTVDQLADRTRIRPHVIESIEVDDFAPCGGDFYARGHLRTLARVLGVEAGPLLASYDDRYADAPIDARRVFEAELATGADGPIRGTRGGPNWSVLVAAVMAVVLAWSIARLVMDSPIQLDQRPVLNGSPSNAAKLGPAVPVLLDASSGGAHVVVRDGAGEVVFNGDLAFGDSRTVKAAPPVLVQSSDGALGVTIDGEDRGPLGTVGQPASNTFAAPE